MLSPSACRIRPHELNVPCSARGAWYKKGTRKNNYILRNIYMCIYIHQHISICVLPKLAAKFLKVQ